jgi:glucosamine 6-phosphate synthetase-like amidotransferase/phosphosugar isomerase protein
VLLIENGRLHSLAETLSPAPPVDEFLSPILDVIPIQLYTDELARRRGIEPGFRYISKVVQRL